MDVVLIYVQDVISTAAEVANILDATKRQQPTSSAGRAAKKGVVDKGKVYRKTRLCDTLTAEDPAMKNFNLNNFKKTSSEPQLKYMLQKMVELIVNQFDKIGLPLSSQADMVAFMIKNFQKGNIFAAVDHAIFVAEPNQVLKSKNIIETLLTNFDLG